MTTDKKTYTIIYHRAAYIDGDGDRLSSEELGFDEDQDIEQLEQTIYQKLANWDDRDESEWEFLIQLNGHAIFGTGEHFDFGYPWEPDSPATEEEKTRYEQLKKEGELIKAMFEATSKRAEMARQERKRKAEEEAAEQSRRYREQQERREYYAAKERYEQLKGKFESQRS